MQIVIEISEELKAVGEAVEALARQIAAAWRSTRGGKALAYAEIEQQLAAGAAAIERGGHQAILQGLDVDRPQVLIEGKEYVRGGRYEATYYTLAGAVGVARALYREGGESKAQKGEAGSRGR